MWIQKQSSSVLPNMSCESCGLVVNSMNMRSVLLILSSLALSCVRANRPLVKTTLGEVEGVWQTSDKGLQYAAFMGIPYAQPPVRDLRFEPPEEAKPWEGVQDAGNFGSQCIAYWHLRGPGQSSPIMGHEDCLFINIYTPSIPEKELKEEKLLNVILYIHGGAFMYGKSNSFGAKYLMDRNVVFITINYRLGPLGFLSFEDSIVPGNNGLRDQIMALQWIKKHISKFGGNPKSVTLMGHSAGGASVHFHFLSPLARALFKNGISMSGTATVPWALVDNARETAMKFATIVGCKVDNGTEHTLTCLKHVPADRLVRAVDQFTDWQNLPVAPFGPVIEHNASPKYPPFLHHAPLELMKTGQMSRLPWLVGIVDAEGIYPVGSFIANETELKKLDEDFDELAPHLLDYYHTVNESERLEVTRRIRNKYFGVKNITKDCSKQLIKMVSDRLFVLDADLAAKIQSQFSPVYFYKGSRRPLTSFSDLLSGTTNNYGTSHGDDLNYLMNVTYGTRGILSDDYKPFSEMMLDLWTSFARLEQMYPVSASVTWEQVYANGDLKYLNLNGNVPASMAVDNNIGNAEFWTSLPINEEAQRMPKKNVVK